MESESDEISERTLKLYRNTAETAARFGSDCIYSLRPDTVLAFLAEIERLRAEVDRLKQFKFDLEEI